MIRIDGIKHYTGGKSGDGTYQTIINEIRPHHILIIPFLGHCGITRAIKRADLTIGIDTDRWVIDRWQAMNFNWIKLYCHDPSNTLITCR